MAAYGIVCMRSGEAHAGWGPAPPPGGETDVTPACNAQSPRWGPALWVGIHSRPMPVGTPGPSPDYVWEQPARGVERQVQALPPVVGKVVPN